MPFLIPLLGLDVAAPVFSLIGQTMGILMLIRYRQHLNWQSVWHVSLFSLIGIPIGIWLAHNLDEHLVLMILGIFTLVYAVYSLVGMDVPRLRRRWGTLLGFISGLLHGAYNTGGPPLVIYGTSQQWNPEAFKCNIQSLFFMNGIFVIITHTVAGHFTQEVWQYFWLSLPFIFIGLWLGGWLDRYVKPESFRRGVLLLLVGLALTLIF